MAPYLSIVIPAYQEAGRLPPTLAQLGKFGREFKGGLEVLVVVEASPDGTLKMAREVVERTAHPSIRWEVIDNGPQRGKGHAVRSGMQRATGDFIFYMDADLSVPLREIGPFLACFADHPEIDVLVGNRQHAGSRITRAQTWLRRSMGQTFNRLLAALALTEIRNTQCGFKGFRRAAAQAIFARQRLDGFAFDVEVLVLARELGLTVCDLPVEWLNSPESKVKIIRDSARMLWDAVRLRLS